MLFRIAGLITSIVSRERANPPVAIEPGVYICISIPEHGVVRTLGARYKDDISSSRNEDIGVRLDAICNLKSLPRWCRALNISKVVVHDSLKLQISIGIKVIHITKVFIWRSRIEGWTGGIRPPRSWLPWPSQVEWGIGEKILGHNRPVILIARDRSEDQRVVPILSAPVSQARLPTNSQKVERNRTASEQQYHKAFSF
jgi:hypothetical protein